MDVREKLVELLKEISYDQKLGWYDLWDMREGAEDIADLLIAHGATVQEWISVKDRLPNVYFQDVLVYDEMDACMFLAVMTNKGEWLVPHYEGYKFNITHWMPLPQPPKGE